MRRALSMLVPAAFLLIQMGVYSQTMASDHWSHDKLLERSQHLRELASQGDGSASETLEKYPHHYTMLAFRSRNGGGEIHRDFADMFTILDGHVTLITGGEVVDAKTTAPGEVRGASVKGGVRQQLSAGDVVHIPAGTPHQMLVADGDTVTYFVVKVEENR
jgi:hypothetical protein